MSFSNKTAFLKHFIYLIFDRLWYIAIIQIFKKMLIRSQITQFHCFGLKIDKKYQRFLHKEPFLEISHILAWLWQPIIMQNTQNISPVYTSFKISWNWSKHDKIHLWNLFVCCFVFVFCCCCFFWNSFGEALLAIKKRGFFMFLICSCLTIFLYITYILYLSLQKIKI